MNDENIEEILKRLGSEDVPAEVQKIAQETAESFSKTLMPSRQHMLWRTIMKSPITKLAAAAVIIIAVLAGIHQFSGSINASSVAWGDVIQHTTQVDYVHVYYFKSRDNDFIRHFEGWYAYGKLFMRGNGGDTIYDDGKTQQTFDDNGRRTVKTTSFFAEGLTFLEVFTAGLLSDKNEQFSQQTPTIVGEDFLVYRLDPPPEESDWMESVSFTVGKNSLLPVQMKVHFKDSDYDLVLFDYEAPEEPPEFFEAPTVQSPNGRGEVVLDGEEVMIDIYDAPGLKTAIACLHSKSSDEGEPTFSLDVTFITEEGFRSATNDVIRLKAGEAKQCGTGSSGGGLDNWPDGKYRNIRFSPLLKATDREDTFIVEITCWIKTK